MIVCVLSFAAVRDITGTDECTVTLPDEVATVEDFARHMVALYPALAGRMASIRIARNESFAVADERVEDGDVLALIPPVSGG